MTIKNYVKKYRIYKNLTQDELAKKIEVSRSMLAEIENHNKYPKYQIRTKLCNFFNVRPKQLFYKE